MTSPPEASQQRLSISQEFQSQAALLRDLKVRHRNESEGLNARQATEMAELRARQAVEEQVALTRMLKLHQETATHLRSQQLHVQEVSALHFLKKHACSSHTCAILTEQQCLHWALHQPVPGDL